MTGLFEILGGRGSGHHGHSGRPGKKGGSSTKGGGKVKLNPGQLQAVKAYKEQYIEKKDWPKKAPDKAVTLNREIGAYEGVRRAYVKRAESLQGKQLKAMLGSCIKMQNLANWASAKRNSLLKGM